MDTGENITQAKLWQSWKLSSYGTVACNYLELISLYTSSLITELSVRHSNHQETGGNLKGTRVPPGWGGLMLMYSRQTLVSTQPGGRPTIMFSGDVSSTRQHSIRGLSWLS